MVKINKDFELINYFNNNKQIQFSEFQNFLICIEILNVIEILKLPLPLKFLSLRTQSLKG
jgi:hypothetical protein